MYDNNNQDAKIVIDFSKMSKCDIDSESGVIIFTTILCLSNETNLFWAKEPHVLISYNRLTIFLVVSASTVFNI